MKVRKTTGNDKRTKLTPSKVAELRKLWKQGLTYQELADSFGICYESARTCATGVTWNWIDKDGNIIINKLRQGINNNEK